MPTRLLQKAAATFAVFFQECYLCTRAKCLLKFYASGQMRRANSRNIYVEFQIYLSYVAFYTRVFKGSTQRAEREREKEKEEKRDL